MKLMLCNGNITCPGRGHIIAQPKGEVSRKFAVISKSVSRNNEIIVKFVINYRPSVIKLSISASGLRQSRPV